MMKTNKITSETLKHLGDLLRKNKGLKEMIIKNGGHQVITDKKEFCNEILSLLKNENLLQLHFVKRAGYMGQTMNFENALRTSDVEQITVSVYVERKKPETLGETLVAEGWSLD